MGMGSGGEWDRDRMVGGHFHSTLPRPDHVLRPLPRPEHFVRPVPPCFSLHEPAAGRDLDSGVEDVVHLEQVVQRAVHTRDAEPLGNLADRVHGLPNVLESRAVPSRAANHKKHRSEQWGWVGGWVVVVGWVGLWYGGRAGFIFPLLPFLPLFLVLPLPRSRLTYLGDRGPERVLGAVELVLGGENLAAEGVLLPLQLAVAGKVDAEGRRSALSCPSDAWSRAAHTTYCRSWCSWSRRSLAWASWALFSSRSRCRASTPRLRSSTSRPSCSWRRRSSSASFSSDAAWTVAI